MIDIDGKLAESFRLKTLKGLSDEYHGQYAFEYTTSRGASTHLTLELNGTQYDVLEVPPSALEFSRLVHIARPVLIKGTSLLPTMRGKHPVQTVSRILHPYRRW